jgi:hypothetical protein
MGPQWGVALAKSFPLKSSGSRDRRGGATSGEDVEQRAEHLVRRPNHVGAGFGEQIRLAQIGQRIQRVLVAGVRYLLRVLVEQLATARNRSAAAADCGR